MRSPQRTYTRFLLVFAVLGVLGISATIFILLNQRVTSPFLDTYIVNARFSAAHGVLGGIGQPVNVVGVPVGQVTDVELSDGTALVTMRLRRDQLPQVWRNARATLEPVSPLGDAQIDLNPGDRTAGILRSGATLSLAATEAPVRVSDLLERLDSDTRDYLTSLLQGLEEGTSGRGPDLRKALLALGPTARQAGQVTEALAERREALEHFVTNLGRVTKAAASDKRLATLVAAGHQTLAALAAEDEPLRMSIAKLPATLAATESTLEGLKPFSDELGPTVSRLLPAVRKLPSTLKKLGSFSRRGSPIVRNDVRPLVKEARPLLREADPTVAALDKTTPPLTDAARTVNYFLNELAYVPGDEDQGFLFWLAWGLHNLNATFEAGDANGVIGRATVIASCSGLQAVDTLKPLFASMGVCPE